MSENHHFGAGSFTDELWIAGKRVFTKVLTVDVEFTSGGVWDWLIADATGAVVKTDRRTHVSGWTSLHLASHGLYGDYSIGFRNASAGAKSIKQGDVEFG
ncbi:hypothetical protein [Kaistia terrae]|uniref:Uncharacterized protein n=1 Tax=Kaistia terrae TaxID=537017 RepID=A0ABW0Q637_9HYPH|nr:hypothetical protein [Kaistia terrae]MCX5578919.1 hypothetical protein [Kaistia terrae]